MLKKQIILWIVLSLFFLFLTTKCSEAGSFFQQAQTHVLEDQNGLSEEQNELDEQEARSKTGPTLSVILKDALPRFKKTNLKSQTVTLGPKTKLSSPDSMVARYKAVFNSINKKLALISASGNNIPISIKIIPPTDMETLPKDVASVLDHKEGYVIEILSDGVKILSDSELGALHGLTTLEIMLDEHKGEIKQGRISDWPDLKIRALHVPLGNVKPEEIKDLIKLARYGHFNTFILQLRRYINITSMKTIALPAAWTKEEFLDVVRFTRENGLEFIPEIKLLTHQEKFLGEKHPEFKFNKATYDPRREETYVFVLSVLDEIIDLIHPKAIHIGHDEVAGYGPGHAKKWLRKGEKMLLADLFLKDTERLHNHLKSRGVETWMWGDMLLAQEKYPGMYKWHLHARNPEYAQLLSRLPKDIVITDWHYKDEQTDFPSSLAFKRAGHKVIGATWKKPETIRNFSRYIANLPGEGMIATTWSHVQRKEYDIVNKIIKISAESFWNSK